MTFFEEKASRLAEWNDRKRTLMRPSSRGGLGYVDPEIVPLCDALNNFKGVCTLQSCAGHPADKANGAAYSGNLWLRLESRIARQFETKAQQLASESLIERLGKIYWEDGRETITVAFKGNESGCLNESSAVILRFFAALEADK